MSLFHSTHLRCNFHGLFFTLVGDKVMAQRTPSSATAKAQHTASSGNIKHPAYSTKYICLMEPKRQSIVSPTAFPIKLGKHSEQLACLGVKHVFLQQLILNSSFQP